jgi:hypothetical protein
MGYIMYDDLIINKISTINKCIERIRYEYNKSENSIKLDFTRQDSIILNLERTS